MSRGLSINFYGFWDSFKPEQFLEHHPYLRGRYHLEVSDDPDFAICGVFKDGRTLPDRAVKIAYITENVLPDLDRFDWAVSFSHFEPVHPRHLRLPLYAWYVRQFNGSLDALIRQPDERPGFHRPGFCNFVFRNPMCKPRNELFRRLSQYKHIDAPGTLMNNMPRLQQFPGEGDSPAKQRFARGYKFTIAYENASSPGYTTEKITDAMMARSIPIYWGNPLVHLDFNPRSFLNRHDFASDQAFIDRIIEVDSNDDLYESIFREPYWHDNRVPSAISNEVCLAFWDRIFASVPARA